MLIHLLAILAAFGVALIALALVLEAHVSQWNLANGAATRTLGQLMDTPGWHGTLLADKVGDTIGFLGLVCLALGFFGTIGLILVSRFA